MPLDTSAALPCESRGSHREFARCNRLSWRSLRGSFRNSGPVERTWPSRLRFSAVRRLPRRYWTWLGSTLELTVVGRVLFTVVAGLGLLGVIDDDTTGGVDGPNAAAVLGFYVLLALLAIIAADHLSFQPIRSAVRGLRGTSTLG